MTTVVANLECMAADHRMTSEGPIAHVRKIRRIADSLYGVAGDVMMAGAFLLWLESPKRSHDRLYKMISEDGRSDFSVLELSPQGLALWDGWGVRLPLLDHAYAIGTGSYVALQAMRGGMSPAEAVLQSPALDEYSGAHAGEAEVEYLLPPELLPRKRRGK